VSKFLEMAEAAARDAGRFIVDNFEETPEVLYKDAARRNPYSRVDRGAQDAIVQMLHAAYPDHGFIAEEKGSQASPAEYTWVIDPLDGTVNFVHRVKYFAVSIALMHHESIILGVVYNPVMDEIFCAESGEGAFLNGHRISVSGVSNLAQGLLAMGFPYDHGSAAFKRSLDNFARVTTAAQATRRDGSTALSLCNVACGRYDGFVVEANSLWDYAAGVLIIREAGGRVTDFEGHDNVARGSSSQVVASNSVLHGSLLACVTRASNSS
jgi:myo-inositol-1(or 4)-monophosphatase